MITLPIWAFVILFVFGIFGAFVGGMFLYGYLIDKKDKEKK